MNLWINRINAALAISFYALFFLVPLVIYSHSYELFEFNKMWVVFGITVIIGFLWISKMIVLRRIVFRRTPLDIPILIFLISQFLSTIISMDTHTSIWGYYSRFNGGFLSTLAYITLYYAMASNLIGIAKESPEIKIRTWRNKVKSFFNNQTIPFSYKLLAISLLSGFVVVLWGTPSHFGYDPTCLVFRGQLNVDCWTEAFQPTVRIFSTLGQPNWLAAYLSILIFPIMALFIATKRQIQTNKIFSFTKETIIPYSLFLILVLFYLCLTWTKSQSGFLGFWAGLIAFIAIIKFFIWREHGFNIQKAWQNSLLKTMAILAGIFVVLNLFVGFPIERLNSLTLPELVKKQSVQTTAPSADTALSSLGGTNSGKIRLIVWRGALDIFKHNPILGSGVETFAYSYYKYRPVEHNNTSEWDYLYNKAHNEYLNYAATSGILGIGSYLLIIGVFLWTSLRYVLRLDTRNLRLDAEARSSKIDKNQSSNFQSQILTSSLERPVSILIAISLIASYISILVSNFFGFSVVIVNLFFFIIPVMVYEFLGYGKMAKPQEVKQTDKPVDIISKGGVLVVGVITIYLLATLLKYWEADKTFALGYNLNRLGEYTAASPELINATKLRPSEPMFRDELSINLGTVALMAYQNDEATEAAKLAEQAKMLSDDLIENHPNNVSFYKSRTRMLYAISQIDPKYLDDAIVSIEKASKLAPTDPKIKYNKAVFYGKNGDTQKAIKLLEETVKEKRDYYDTHYGLAVFYVQAAKEASNSAQTTEYNNRATQLLQHILKNIAPGDPDAKGLLETIQ